MAKKKIEAQEFIVLEEEGTIIEPIVNTDTPFKPNPLLLPVSIVIAGVLIAGAIIYNGRIANLASATNASTNNASTATTAQLTPDFVGFAKKLKLNITTFQACINGQKFQTQINASTTDGNSVGVSGTPTIIIGRIDHTSNTITGSEIFGAYPYDTFATVLDAYLKSSNPTFDSTIPVSSSQVTVTLSNGFYEGNSKASVGLLEFADYECPYCKAFFDNSLSSLRSNYIDKGSVYHIFKDYPLTSIHPYALPGAEAARCAGDQGKYWQMHDLIYENQT